MKNKILIKEYNEIGLKHFYRGKYREALKFFNKSLRIDSRNIPALMNKGIIYLQLNQVKKGIDYYSRAYKIKPQEPEIIWRTALANFSYLSQYKKAIELSKKILKRYPRMADAYFLIGLSYKNLSNYKKAIEYYDKALKIRKKDNVTWGNKGVALRSLGDYKGALRCFDVALKLDPSDPLIWSNKGAVLSDIGQNDEAITCYKKSLRLNPRDVLALSNLGNRYLELKKYKKAKMYLDLALKFNPDDSETLTRKGLYILHTSKVGQEKQAEKYFNKVLSKNPNFIQALLGKARLYSAIWQDKMAIKFYNKVLSISKNNFEAMVEKANLLSLAAYAIGSTNKVKEAVKIYKKVLTKDNKNISVLKNLIEDLFSLKQYGQAKLFIGRLSRLQKNKAEVQYFKGRYYFLTKNKKKAIIKYKAALSRIKDGFFTFCMALDFAELKDYENALKSINKTIGLDKEKTDANFSMKGEYLFKLGRYKQAMKTINEGLKIVKKDVPHVIWMELLYYKARCLEKMGSTKSALRIYSKIIDVDPKGIGDYTKKARQRKKELTKN